MLLSCDNDHPFHVRIVKNMLLFYFQDIKLQLETNYDIIFLWTDLVLTNVWVLSLLATGRRARAGLDPVSAEAE